MNSNNKKLLNNLKNIRETASELEESRSSHLAQIEYNKNNIAYKMPGFNRANSLDQVAKLKKEIRNCLADFNALRPETKKLIKSTKKYYKLEKRKHRKFWMENKMNDRAQNKGTANTRYGKFRNDIINSVNTEYNDAKENYQTIKVTGKNNLKSSLAKQSKIYRRMEFINIINDELKPIAARLSSNEFSEFQTSKPNILKKYVGANKKAATTYRSLLRLERKKSRQQAKLIKKINEPHAGPKNVPLRDESNIVELSKVIKYYSNGFSSQKILHGVDLEIKKGDVVIIFGPSGSGKTTLMNIISGLDRPSVGEVNVAGKNLGNLSQSELTSFRKEHVAYIFQQYGLLPNLTVKENIEMGRSLQTNKKKWIPTDDILTALDLINHANKYPHELSGGQQQRVSVGRALAKNPTLLFGDEPTGALDEEMSKIVLNELVELRKKFKTTVVIVTHNPIFAPLGNVVIKLKYGKIAEFTRNDNPTPVDKLNWDI